MKKFNLILLITLGSFFTLNLFAQSPNLTIINADVRTMDKSNPRAQAIAIVENKIFAVGTNTQIRKLSGKNTKIIDAKGKLVIPGFNDSHVHFFGVGTQFLSVNLKDTKTPAEVLNKIRFHAKFLPKGKWLLGGFQTQEDFPLRIMPSLKQVDAITPNHPALFYLKGANVAFVNSYAMNLAGLTNNSNGILHGTEINSVKKLTPPVLISDVPAILESATNYAASVGVTSVQDMDADNRFEIYRELQRQGKLKTRIYDCIPLTDWQKLADQKIVKATGNELLRRGCLKHFSNGDAEQIPYLLDLIASADKADLQVMMHAIGADANDVMLTVYEKVLAQNGEKDRRFRIEHAHNFRSEDLNRFAATKTIASVQPFLFFNQSGNYPRLFRQMLDSKALFSFGSDANIVDLNPLFGIHAAVFGENSKRGISVAEAVRAYTRDAAFAEFQEDIKGTISVGKLADLVILSDNIFTIPPTQINKVKVLWTILDGKIVYQAE